MGVEGVVVGILETGWHLNMEQMKELMDAAGRYVCYAAQGF